MYMALNSQAFAKTVGVDYRLLPIASPVCQKETAKAPRQGLCTLFVTQYRIWFPHRHEQDKDLLISKN